MSGFSNRLENGEVAGQNRVAKEDSAEVAEESATTGARGASARSRVAGKFKQAAGAILGNRRKEARGVAEQEYENFYTFCCISGILTLHLQKS